jgi:predicted dehydrogenase/threonine dehydrogenase-like Zn-dependent dehydrogenase
VKQVVQPIGGGRVEVLDVPRPTIGPTEVLVRTVASVISPGTERAVTSLAQSSLLSKARARPDLVRQVVRKLQTEGLTATAKTVRARLASDLPLGYSAAGVAVEVGSAVDWIRPGQLVATGGAGRANHAEWQSVPGLLCSPVPEGVSADQAAFTTIASIALHGLRLAEVGPGSRVVVVGLGLVGQLAARLARASGCEVFGIDVAPAAVEVAARAGVQARLEDGEATTEAVLDWSRGRGADAVLLCASGSSSDVARRTPALCRDRARVVVVGDLGLELTRTPFYEKELTLLFARSYGPGRHERSYEDYGVDYPAGQLRWTEGRNFEAVLDLLAAKQLVVDDLVTHRFPIAEAGAAYDVIDAGDELCLAVALDYPAEARDEEPIRLRDPGPAAGDALGVGWIGAGAYSTGVLLPAFAAAGFDHRVAIVSGSGLTARRAAERHGFETVVSAAADVIGDPEVSVVVIATPHDSHAGFAAEALRAGKHVWCEKPLALTEEELDDVEAALADSPSAVLMVGHNRRWSPHVDLVRGELAGAPAVLDYRVNAGPVPAGHWYGDRRQGGRLLGEVCHFIDTATAILGADVTGVQAYAGARGELLLADSFVLALQHANGSISTISYASGGSPSTAKERIEVLGAGHTWLIDDFKTVHRDDKQLMSGRQDKGQRAAAAAFRTALRTGDRQVAREALATARTTIRAADSLGGAGA